MWDRVAPRQYGAGQAPGRSLARLTRLGGRENRVTAITDERGVAHYEDKGIFREFQEFYGRFCSSHLSAVQADIEAFDGVGLYWCSEEQRGWLNRPVTLEEMMDAIKSLPGGNSPGSDGFTAEFYKCYTERLAPYLLRVYQEVVSLGRLPDSLREI